MPPAENSLASLTELLHNPFLPPTMKYGIQLYTAETYEDFAKLIDEVLVEGIHHMELNPQHQQNRREEALTDSLLQHVIALGLDASAETSVGGHCDVIIRHTPKRWLWLGESKIHSDYNHLRGGMNQLLYRYGNANGCSSHGALIIFIYNKKATKVINEWKKKLIEYPDTDEIIPSQQRPAFCFSSHHKETERTGLPFTIKHFGISLHYETNDDLYK